jgi:hypothetical protein
MTQADSEARWRADVLEALRRVGIGIEALHHSAQRQARLSAESNAKVETMLSYVIRLWQGQRRER